MAASLPTNKTYYRPYISDSESDSGSDSDTSSTGSWSTGTESTISVPVNQPPDYRQFASDLQLSQTAGPSFASEKDQLQYEELNIAGPYSSEKDASGVTVPKTESSKTTVTSIIMLDSRNRDTQVYPQPTFLQLRLPRTYKNVTNFQVVQIKLLSSFLYFRQDKNNLSITIHEAGRYLPNGQRNLITNSIRPGTYNIAGLINELTLQLNRTPVFYDYTNGFTDFAPLFASTGDYSLNFNQPGDNYYDALNNVFILNPTMTQIVQKYFQTTSAGLTSYTLDQLKVAYYYPVLKEALLDPAYVDFIELTITTSNGFLLPEETVRSRILYTFQGLNDPIVQEVINNNVTRLDTYRVNHTFRYGLINKYVVSVASNNNRVTINTSQLNTSLVTLLNTKYNQYLTEQLAKYNLTLAQYNALSLTNSALLAILTDEYYYLQKMFALYFGVNFNSYSLSYFTDVYNQIPLQNGTSSSGVSSNYDANVIAKNISPQSMNELSSFRTAPSYYWPRLTALPNSTHSTFYNLNSNAAPSSVSEYSHPYNLLTDAADYVRPFIDASGMIYQNPLYKSANIITNINATEYTVFKFRSNVRQTLRVTALPRPTKYRYPAYNAVTYDASHVRIFDNSYAYIQNAQNSKMDVTASFNTSNLITIPGFNSNQNNFGIQYAGAYALWTSNVTLNIQNDRTFFTFYTPQPPAAAASDTCRYDMTIQVTNIPQTSFFPSPIRMYFYEDRGAFMADISDVRNEKPIHYKQMASFFTNTTIGSITFTAYAKQQYYVMVRSQNTTFTSMQIRVIPTFLYGTSFTTLSTSLVGFDPTADPSTSNYINYNYASVADPNFLELPTASNLWSTRKGVDSNLATYSNTYVPMGYDVSGVSTDLTDYVGYNSATSNNAYPIATTRIDPITGYFFQVGAGYNSNAQKYISAGSGNTLLTSNALTVYNAKTVPERQTSIVHWYSQVFIPNTANQPLTFSNDVSIVYQTNSLGQISTIYSFPYTHDLVYPGIYSQDIGPRTNSELVGYKFFDTGLSLGNGIMGISLIPDDGIWDVKRIMLRSAYVNPAADTNRDIKYVGIYNASYLNTLTGEQVKLSNALMVFELSTAITYTSSSKNFGFDPVPGTYYEWIKMSNLTTASNSYLYGFAQTPSHMITDSNSYYSIVPFTADSNITTYSLISGSLVPYPFYSDASASLFYLDGTSTPTSQYVILPKKSSTANSNLGPPAGFDQSQSKYEQSIPLEATMLQYLQPPLLANLSNALKTFGPPLFQTIQGAPPFTSPCLRVPNYGLFPIGGAYNLYRYQNNTSTQTFTLENTLTADLFFTNLNNAQLVAISGNNKEFAFLGLGATMDSLGNYNYTVQIETYNVSTQILQVRGAMSTGNGLYSIPAGYEIIDMDSFNYNDSGGFTFSLRYGQWDTITSSYINVKQVGQSKASSVQDTLSPVFSVDFSVLGPTQGIVPTFELLQPQRELYGRFYIVSKTRFATSADSVNPVYYQKPTNLKYTVRDFVANKLVNSTDSGPYANNGLYFADPLTLYNTTTVDPFIVLSEQQIGAPSVYFTSTNSYFAAVTRLNLSPSDGSNTPAAFGDFTIVQNPYQSMLFMSYDMYDMSNNGGIPTRTFYQITDIQTANIQFQSNAMYMPGFQVVKSAEGSNLQPYEILGGGGGSFWVLFNEKNRITASNTPAELSLTYDSVWGNRGDSTDFPINISNAYQIFYPTQRIVMTKIGRTYDPITDISGLTYPEFPHTQMFVYDSLAKYQADISGNQWGLESPSNFMVSDTAFSGYYFNAATLDVPLFSNANYYYLALRNYSPTEKSQVMLRFSLPNRYDFGYARFIDVSNEIVMASNLSNSFNSNFASVLQSFNSNFIFDSNGRVFGSNLLAGFAGSNLSNVAGFGDFLNRFISLYAIYNSNVQVLSNINATIQSNLQNFIKSDLANIIPPSALNRQRYTDPIIYSLLWKSSLPPQYLTAEDNWGLGWNLGYAKEDTSYDTTHVADSFYKILDDFINLRLSPEYDMNRMDTGAKENLQLTQDTTGVVKAYHAKLLLANFGSYAQTLISNPLVFQIPIPKIDKLTFTWQDTVGQTINNGDCEWNMVVQMVEQMDTVKPAAPPVVVPGAPIK